MRSESKSIAAAPLTGARFVIGTFAVALATFMNVLDSSIANVAIPTLSGNLGVSVEHVHERARFVDRERCHSNALGQSRRLRRARS